MTTRVPPALRAAAVLYCRETAAYFSSPAAYVVMAAFLLVCGYMFGAQFFLRDQSDIAAFTDVAPLLLTFFVPAVTMRSFAEETKSGTAELLNALPMARWQILAAKFLAAATVMWTALAFTAAYPATAIILGSPDEGVLLASYIGLFLNTAMFGAAGIFASAAARNQVSAFITGFFLCFAFFLAGKMSSFLPPGAGRLTDFLGTDYHFGQFARGIIDSRGVFYFLSTAALFLFFANLRLAAERTK